MRLIADANFVVAVLDRKDSLHHKAITLRDHLKTTAAEVTYADCVINEAIGVITRRFREQRRQGEIDPFLG